MVQIQARQAGFSTTFMGMLKGACGALGLSPSDPDLFGFSGHGFVINIHPELCPSGPYCFDRGPVLKLAESLGITTGDLGFFHGGSTPDERAEVEAKIRAELDAGRPAGLCNLEFQLIWGYDSEGFLTAQPWDCHDFPPSRLSFGSWKELGDSVHISFFAFDRCPLADRRLAAQAALNHAVRQLQLSEAAERPPYGMGLHAFRLWKAALPQHGASHGHWWNAMVWSECRLMAAQWLAGLDEEAGLPGAREAAEAYQKIGDFLRQAAPKELSWEEKLILIEEAEKTEASAAPLLAELAARL